MLSVIILDSGEPKVIQLTYENLYRELKDMEGSQLLVSRDWFTPLKTITNQYVCLVEPDCLVNSGYFASMMGLINKNSHLRKLGIFGSATGVNHFGNRFYGYALQEIWSEPAKLEDGKELRTKNRYVEPVREKKSTEPYPIQIAYVPGSIIRRSMLLESIDKLQFKGKPQDNLAKYSADLSLYLWSHGARIHINPNTTYVTTEDYVNDLGQTEEPPEEILASFKKESI